MTVNTLTLYMPGSSVGIQVVEGSQLHLIYAAMGFSATPSAPGPPTRPDPFPQYVHDDELAQALVGVGGGVFVAGAVIDADGNLDPTKRLMCRTTADGTDIDDLFIEDVA